MASMSFLFDDDNIFIGRAFAMIAVVFGAITLASCGVFIRCLYAIMYARPFESDQFYNFLLILYLTSILYITQRICKWIDTYDSQKSINKIH